MCGIIGYTGDRRAIDVIVNGLRRLEYRGYDSAGIAVIKDEKLSYNKKPGKLQVLVDELRERPIEGTVGAGHVRWATHGVPNEVNAHPHFDTKGEIAVVHNGIIENHLALKKQLIKEGHKFTSQTDTEVIPHLIEKYYKGDLTNAVRQAVNQLKGSYAICCVHTKEPGKMVGVRCDSPLIVGIGNNENFLASDVPAILDYAKDVIYLNNQEIVEVSKESVKIIDRAGKAVRRKPSRVEWDIKQAQKSGFPHFMLKEIHEQDAIVKDILNERLKNGEIVFEELKIKEGFLKKIKKIAIVACGTAYHAGMAGQYIMEELARVPVWADTSSEFRYRNPLVGKDTLVILISQSGETADTLAALREAAGRGAKTLAICNVLGSSIAREADGVIYTHAGPEIAVASTKAYTAQLALIYLLAIQIAGLRKAISAKRRAGLLEEFKKVPKLLTEILGTFKGDDNKIAQYAHDFREYYPKRQNKSTFLYLARGVNYPNAREGALKLKEISYIAAEGYPAGEMKHGPIALIDENPWVVCIVTGSSVYDKMLSNIEEVKARGGIVIAIVTKGDKEIRTHRVDYVIEIPKTEELFSPILTVIPLQLLAYYVAREFGCDIDQPRNLAKSVTVE